MIALIALRITNIPIINNLLIDTNIDIPIYSYWYYYTVTNDSIYIY